MSTVGLAAIVGLALIVADAAAWIGLGSSYITVVAFALAALVLAFYVVLGLLNLISRWGAA